MIARYKLEPDAPPCVACGKVETWSILDTVTDTVGGQSYGIREQAQDIVDLMNEAYEAGVLVGSQ